MPALVKCHCGQPLRVRDEDLGGRVRCPSCAAVLALPAPVEAPAARVPDAPRPPSPPPPPLPAPARAYWLLLEGASAGPFGAPRVAALLASGVADAASPCCPVGEGTWRPLGEVPELAASLPLPPP